MSLLREVLAKVLFGDLGQCAILLQLDNGFVDFLDQVIAALAERQVGGRSLLGLHPELPMMAINFPLGISILIPLRMERSSYAKLTSVTRTRHSSDTQIP